MLPKKSPRKHKIPRDRRALMRKRLKLQKKIHMSTNHHTKENVLNQIKEIENNLKISINTERNLRETRATFDKVDHGILLNKLKKIGINGKIGV